MTTLTCPKCRQGTPDSALDVGQCPACGFPLDGPLVLGTGTPNRSRALRLATGGLVLAAAGAACFALFGLNNEPPPGVAATAPEPGLHAPQPAPPDVPKPVEPPVAVTPEPPAQAGTPARPPVVEPKRVGPRPVGVVMKVDPKITPERHFDHPDDTAALPDLNGGRVTLTGRVRALRIGSVHRDAAIDASGLVAEEVTITGDLDGNADVTLNAPAGRVTIGGYVVGSSKLTIQAAGGEVVLLASSGRMAGRSVTTVTAKRVDAAGRLSGSAQLHLTLGAGGSLKLTSVEENATVSYKKAAAGDPPLLVDKGVIKGGAKVLAE